MSCGYTFRKFSRSGSRLCVNFVARKVTYRHQPETRHTSRLGCNRGRLDRSPRQGLTASHPKKISLIITPISGNSQLEMGERVSCQSPAAKGGREIWSHYLSFVQVVAVLWRSCRPLAWRAYMPTSISHLCQSGTSIIISCQIRAPLSVQKFCDPAWKAINGYMENGDFCLLCSFLQYCTHIYSCTTGGVQG